MRRDRSYIGEDKQLKKDNMEIKQKRGKLKGVSEEIGERPNWIVEETGKVKRKT